MTNNSGITPLDTRVLVRTDDIGDKFEGTSLLRPETTKEKEDWAQTKAILVEAGANAFIEWGDSAPKPKPGDRIIIGRYAGSTALHDGADGKKYRICKDEDVLAVLGG